MGLGSPSDSVEEEAWRWSGTRDGSEEVGEGACGESSSPYTSEVSPPTSTDQPVKALDSSGLYSQFVDVQIKAVKYAFMGQSEFDVGNLQRVVVHQIQINQKMIDFLESQRTGKLGMTYSVSPLRPVGPRCTPSPPPSKPLEQFTGHLEVTSTNMFNSQFSDLSYANCHSKYLTNEMMTEKDCYLRTSTSIHREEESVQGKDDLDEDIYRLTGDDRTLVGLPLSPVRKWSGGSADCDLMFGLKEVPPKKEYLFLRESFFEHLGDHLPGRDTMEDN